MIEDRRKNSVVWRVIHMLGSLNLALILLATIAIACAVATFTESNFNTKIAQAYIYKAPWFLVWLGVLCVNLFCVTLTRWPWQKKHIGFVVTHYGIITLLIGAMIGSRTGFEGNVTLRKDGGDVSRVTTSRSIIQIESPADSGLYVMDFNAETTRPSEKRPRKFPVPGTKLSVVADDFSDNLIRENRLTNSTSPGAGVGVLLTLSSKVANQTVPMTFFLAPGQEKDAQDFFGMAQITLNSSLGKAPDMPVETRMVFAKYESVSQGQSSGVLVRLSEDGSKVTIASPDGTGATYLRKEIMGKPVNEAGSSVVVENYWPDFAMQNGQPSTKSEEPDNPAMLVRITKAAGGGRPGLDFIVAGGLAPSMEYQLTRGGQPTASGTAKPGQTFALGWGDWQAQVSQIVPRASLTGDVRPGPKLEKGQRGIPGFRAHLEGPDGKKGADVWVETGQIVTLVDGSNLVEVGYGLETKPLPFDMHLVKFEVPRDEGTETPSNFLATVEFHDPKTGETKQGVAQMNRPASFPGTFFANLTGFNYKFSQAEWNPRDLNETTLQVLYDPGWLLKWLGSLGIVIGIGIMFYWKPGGG